MVGLSGSALGKAQQDAVAEAGKPSLKTSPPDSRLPDGTEHVSWEQPLKFSKTYYVDNSSSRARDDGPGTRQRPFRTINKAAQVVQPGERVLIASGTYRECVRPVRGGTGPAQMISYKAVPGAKVFIKGSEVFKDGWQPEFIPIGFRFPSGPSGQAPAQIPAWQHDLLGTMFPDGYNPFGLASAPGDRSWLDTKSVDMGPYFRCRELVFVDGNALEPMEQLRGLASARLPGPSSPGAPIALTGLPARARGGPIVQEIGGLPDARFWVENSENGIYIRMPAGTDLLPQIRTPEYLSRHLFGKETFGQVAPAPYLVSASAI